MILEVKEIFTGVVGGIIVALLGWGISILKQYKDKKRFPVEGEYLTYFEDIENGQTITVTAISTLKQKGSRVIGKTIMPNKRSWTLDGTVLGTGHIAGVYSADASYDEGVGSFYLKILGNSLEGMWSGYDHVNKITSSGRYYFKKKASIKIREISDVDTSHILSLALPLFGEGYVSDFQTYINSKNGVALVALENGKIVGFLLGKSCNRDEVGCFFKDATCIPSDVIYSDKEGSLGVIKTIGVESVRQGHGIGQALINKAESDLEALGAKTVIVPAWKNGKTIYIDGLMKHFGYKKFLEDKGYWKEDCEKGIFNCPEKTGGKCICSVQYYKKSL